jgi:hypothetical protein
VRIGASSVAFALSLVLACGSQAPAASTGSSAEQPDLLAPSPGDAELVHVGPGEHNEDTHMNDIDFGLTDSQYWTDPLASRMQVFRALKQLGRDVVAIGAPQFAPIDQRESLPVLAFRCGPMEQIYNVPFASHAVMVVVELERNRVAIGPIANEEDVELPPPPDAKTMMTGTGSENAVVDLRNDLEIDWQPGTLMVTVIMRNLVSNRVRIELGKSPGSYHDEEVERFLAGEAKLAEPMVNPPAGAPLPSYERRAGSPEIPEQPGIALATTRVVVDRAGATSLLYGSFRLPVREHERVKKGMAAGSGRDTAPTAIVGITLVITNSDVAGMNAMRLDVPSWDPLVGATPMVTGHFTIDLLSTGMVGPEAQTYFVYALSGEHLTGPAPAALVSESQLPAGR